MVIASYAELPRMYGGCALLMPQNDYKVCMVECVLVGRLCWWGNVWNRCSQVEHTKLKEYNITLFSKTIPALNWLQTKF